MDISTTTAPDSTQVNADDLIGGPVTVTITDVTKGSSEQPVDIHLAEFPDRVYRPGKSMRRVLIAAWGPEASNYVGRRMTLYRDATIKFGPSAVGGIRISHLSHIDKAQSIALTVTRGQRKPFTVQPLAETQPTTTVKQPTAAQVAKCDDLEELGAMWRASGEERRTQIEDRVAAIKADRQAHADDAHADMRDDAEAQDTLDKVLGVEE